LQRKKVGNLTKFKVQLLSKEPWSVVRLITGRTCQTHNISGINADVLNIHYAKVSTDPSYTPPILKLTAVSGDQE